MLLEEIEITGIVLNSIRHGEKDRLIKIFSVELGCITGILKGVDGSNAKLKFACQSFCFARFDLVKNGDFYTVKQVDLIDTFFDLTGNYNAYALCSSMLEICGVLLKPGIISENLFLCLIKSLKGVVYSQLDEYLVALKFYLDLLNIIGYKPNFEYCDNCGMKFVGDIKFDYQDGTFRCLNCPGGIKISKKDFMTIKIIYDTKYEKLYTIKIHSDSIKSALHLILHNVCNRLNYNIKSFKIDEI